jgi:membrane protein DedA with SNARE-associated domain
MLDGMLDWLAGMPVALQYLALAALSAMENVFPPVPADVAVALGAFLSQRGESSAVVLGLVCWSANIGSAAAVYGLGRRHGANLLQSAWARRLLTPTSMEALRMASDRHGVWGIFVSRFLPGFRAAVPPFAGIVGIGPLRALLPMAIASGLWYAFLIGVGVAAGSSWESVRSVIEDAQRLLGLLALGALAALAVWFWRGR